MIRKLLWLLLALSGCASHKAEEYLPVNYKDLYLYPEKFDNQKVEIEGDATFIYGEHVFLGSRSIDDCKKSEICLDLSGMDAPNELEYRRGIPECHRIKGVFSSLRPNKLRVGSGSSAIGSLYISEYKSCEF